MPIVPRPNYPTAGMDTAMGAGFGGEVQPNTDAEETAVSYIEASISMLKNAAESFPPLGPGVQQVAKVMRQVLEQVIMGAQGPAQPPEGGPSIEPQGESPAMPPPAPPLM